MTQQDHWTDTLRRKEKADEDRYFAEQDRKQIEQLHRQRQTARAATPPEAEPAASADNTPSDSKATTAAEA